MKTVAIYGFAPQTRDFVNESDAEEVWSLNNFYNYGLDEARVTRTFEIHELWHQFVYSKRELEGAMQYMDWLTDPHPFTIYMAKDKEDFRQQFIRAKRLYAEGGLSESRAIEVGMMLQEAKLGYDFFCRTKANIKRYPLEDMIREFFPDLPTMDVERFPPSGVRPYFVSSIDYMSALAIYEGFERIEYYGVELREKTEWAMQKSGATFWIGVARGRGIEVAIPKYSVLIKAPLYGIETGAQMIPIQVPEELKRMLSMEFDRQRNIHNHNTGKYTELVEMIDRLLNEEDKSKIDFHRAAVEEIYANTARSQEIKEIREELQKVQDEASGSMIKMYLAEGGMNSMTHLIKNENLELEPITLESITRLEYIEKNEPVPEEVPA